LAEISEEIEFWEQKLQEKQENNLEVARSVMDSIIQFHCKSERDNLMQQDIRILGSIDIWL
jgi:hypothetical protein